MIPINLTSALFWMGRLSLHASVLALLIGAIVWTMQHRVRASWRFALWLLVFARLLVPLGISVHFAIPWTTPSPRETAAAGSSSAPVVVDRRAMPMANSPAVAKPAVAPARSVFSKIRSALWKNLPAILASIWVVGFLSFVGRMLQASVCLRRSLRQLPVTDDPELLRGVDAAARLLGLSRSPRVLMQTGEIGPALAGCWRPVLLLPVGICDRLTPRETRLVILHELAHLCRKDVPINCIVSVLAAMHWFNPIVWWSLHRLREERELACDERVLAATAGDVTPADYGHVLLQLIHPLIAPSASSFVRAAPGAVGMFETGHSLNRRIAMIARYRNGTGLHRVVGVALLMPLLAVAFTNAAGPVSVRMPVTGPLAVASSADAGSSNARETMTLSSDVEARLSADPRIAKFRQLLDATEIELQLAMAKFGPQHANVVQLRTLLDLYKRKYDELRAAKAAEVAGANGAGVQTNIGAAVAAAPPMNPAAGDAAIPASQPSSNAAVVPSPTKPKAAASVAVDGDTQGNAAVDAQLRHRLPELHFNANSFGDVIDFLRDLTGANIFVNWAVLEAAGVSKDSPVTLRVRDVTFNTALNLILQSMSVNVELVYTVEGGVICITTADHARDRIVMQTYDVGAIAPNEEALQVLEQTIHSNIDPGSWKDAGGEIGSISAFNGKLVITNTSLTQQKIAALLQSLGNRDASTTRPSAAPTPTLAPAR